MLLVSSIVLGGLAILAATITHNGNLSHLIARCWGQFNLLTAGVKVRVKGLENLPLQDPCVLIANHQGWFDIFVILAKLPVQFRWLAKEELFHLPVFGKAMSSAGYIPINREDKRQALESMNQAALRIKSGTSVVVFPEGTRSPDGTLQEFKKGGFILAIKAQQPIVPITLSGSHHVLPKGDDWVLQPRTVDMTIDRPIPTTGLILRDKDSLLDTVRKIIREHLTVEEGGQGSESS
jgi:1-acyl-sn-glycerol-3-phosphate acyltransferase